MLRDDECNAATTTYGELLSTDLHWELTSHDAPSPRRRNPRLTTLASSRSGRDYGTDQLVP
jgi:hypothetical protein